MKPERGSEKSRSLFRGNPGKMKVTRTPREMQRKGGQPGDERNVAGRLRSGEGTVGLSEGLASGWRLSGQSLPVQERVSADRTCALLWKS